MPSDPPHTLKILTVWLLLGLAVFLAVQWWQREQRQTRIDARGGTIRIARATDGHYHWPGQINGRAVDFLVDTGATQTALPATLAKELGLTLDGEVWGSTAGGMVHGREARADVQLQGGVRVDRLRVSVLPALEAPLLGMNVLGHLHWRQQDGVLSIDTGTAP
jgi:aspartyl protease family protein